MTFNASLKNFIDYLKKTAWKPKLVCSNFKQIFFNKYK